MNRRVLLYVGLVRKFESWLAENLNLFAGNGNENGSETYPAARVQKKRATAKGGRNWK